MEHMPRIRGLATAAVAGLLTVSMTACGVFDRDQETVTVTQTPASPNSSSNGSAGGASGNGGPAPTPAAPAAAPQAPAAPAQTRYTTYYAATSNTSESFAAAVFSAFTATYASTGNSEPTLSVTSPATGQTYTMQCAHYGHTVHCNGGDNAVVGIY